jgi:hypothetical protein
MCWTVSRNQKKQNRGKVGARDSHLISNGNILIRERIRTKHSGLNVLIFWHLYVLIEKYFGPLAFSDFLEVLTNLEEVVVGCVTPVEPSGQYSAGRSSDRVKTVQSNGMK